VEYDVTSAVTGNGPVSFAITTTSSNSQYATSREGANKPQLVIGGGSTPPPPPPGPIAPTADFSGTPTTGTAPLRVDFTDASTGSPTAWEWDFQNDGTTDSTTRNPSFTYTTPGTYAVKLTARNATGSDVETKLGYVTVGSSPGPGTGTRTLEPVADAHVKSTSATKNYGTVDHLRLRNGGTSSDTYRTYVKFNVAGLTAAPASAKLRLYSTDGGPDGGSVSTAGNAWTETGITWNGAPALGGTSLASAGTVADNAWVDFDVTSAVRGNGEVTFALTTTSSNSVYFTSREGVNKPQLVLLDGTASLTATAFSARSAALPALASTTDATASDAAPPVFVCPLPDAVHELTDL
jgi:PKD repeat protein